MKCTDLRCLKWTQEKRLRQLRRVALGIFDGSAEG